MKTTTTTDTVIFSVKGQIVIPRRIRKEFEIEKGTRARISTTPDGIVIQPITAKLIRSLKGSLKGSKAWEIFLAERERERNL